jgi:hypothetical protein
MGNQLDLYFPVDIIESVNTEETTIVTLPSSIIAVQEYPSDSDSTEEGNQIVEGSLAAMEVRDSLPYRVDIHPNPSQRDLEWNTLSPTIVDQPGVTWSQVRSREMEFSNQSRYRFQDVGQRSIRSNSGTRTVTHVPPVLNVTRELSSSLDIGQALVSVRLRQEHALPFVEIRRIPSLPEHRMATNSPRPHVVIQRVSQTQRIPQVRRSGDREIEPSPQRVRQTKPTIKLDHEAMVNSWRICGSRPDGHDSVVRREHRTLAVELGIDPKFIPYMKYAERCALREGRLEL